MILSDGWDTGALRILERAMREIARRAGRVVWLNPLAGLSGYAPEAGGMRTALPYVDVFAPAHDLESLLALPRHLKEGAR